MHGKLELERSEAFHRRDWVAQRIGWAVWAGIIAAALGGLVGTGPLSSRRAAAPDGSLEIHYDRFVRYHASNTLDVLMKPTGAASDQVRLHIGQSFIDAIEVHRIQPEPVETALDKEGIWLSFKKGDQAERVRVTIHYEHQQTLRKVVSSFWLEGHEAATLEQLVYP